MKIALVSTTINVPHVLALYRAAAGDTITFFVAADKKTPPEAYDFCKKLSFCHFCFEGGLKEWRCSPLIGYNTVARRSIAILDALHWGAEIIVTIDDDNYPLDIRYFSSFVGAFYRSHGLQVVGDWFDPGMLLDPPASHRGFPHDKVWIPAFEPVVNVKIGVAAGMVLGDPDVSAATRIATLPQVLGVSELARGGVVVDPRQTWTVFNTQNTAFVRDLAPCFLLCPRFGRYDDIVASLVAQRVMRERGEVVHFGRPFVWQQRNAHDLLRDLAAEQWGQEHLAWIAEQLDGLAIKAAMESAGNNVVDWVRAIYLDLAERPYMGIASVKSLVEAWCDDCARAMG